jgi:multidrug efflux pump subunit AcrA (membrane-fusion protein)
MEFVAYGEGEGEGNDSMDTGLGQMSEKVQAIAQSLYIELEGMVRQFGPEPAQTVTPFLVRLLETLDEEIKQRRTCQTELELAKADREQLLNHYERERELRKKAEEYQFIAEDEADLDKSALQEQLEDLEGRLRHLDTKAQNYDDISRRTAETEDQLKHKYAELSKRHAEILQKYIGLSEENKSLRSSQGSTPLHETQRTKVTKGSPESVTETYNINIISGDTISNAELNESSSSSDLSCKKLDHNKSLDEEMKELSTRSSTQSKNHSPFTDTSSDIPEDVEELIAKTAATVSKDTTGCDLSTQATFDSNRFGCASTQMNLPDSF